MPINNLKIISVNCRGLGDSVKRKDVFSFLRNKNASIYCLQDTHFTKQMEKIIYMQWGYEVYSSYGTSDSRGVTVLLNNNFEFKIMNCITDNDGNYIILSILVENRFTLTLVNLYGPNSDCPDFYIQLKNKLQDNESDYTVVCGDFNLVLDFDRDCYNYVRQNNPRAVNEVKCLCDEISLCDPWRINYPDLKNFTWFRKNPIKKARLDFFLISDHLLTIIDSTSIYYKLLLLL